MAISRAAYRTAVLCTSVFVVTAAAGCARFDDSASTPFTPVPSFSAGEVQPRQPGVTTTPEVSESPRALAPCEDPDPAVVATCLDTTGGLTMLPGGQAALVTERRTGRILRVAPGTAPQEVARLAVDGSGDGGLLDIALSPTYTEDNLLYAYVTTNADNRIVRIAPGDAPKDVLTGIPRGASGNAGALAFTTPTELTVLTGDAGNPSAAMDPASMAGKVLRVTALTPAPVQPMPRVALSGIGTAGDICVDPLGGGVWVTDRTVLEDRLQRVTADGATGMPVWTWPDRPGVAGCTAVDGGVAVALTDGRALAVLPLDSTTGAAQAAPSLVAADRYGRLGGAALGDGNQVWVATVNKAGGEPGPSDDRVVRIPAPQGGGGFD
ncbi:PQQ-dependent sugar dehydrogenase [Rhodococcus sp. NPDC003318]|uniref:PQQ-dependent sugar dehydrogenase n=1 Tax=Rhodococcus sp. NPDC003318 TaxID=3364503 RepID=UPI0036A040C2